MMIIFWLEADGTLDPVDYAWPGRKVESEPVGMNAAWKS